MKEEQQKERIQFRFDISFSSRNELARPVMGTIFLVNKDYDTVAGSIHS